MRHLGKYRAERTHRTVQRLKSLLRYDGWLVLRHALLSLLFVLIYLILNLPGTIFFDRLGSSTWYPANGLALALMLGVSPWYGLLFVFSDTLAGNLIYHQPLASFAETIGAAGVTACYTAAAYVLRGPLRIDRTFVRGSDVIDYLAITSAAAVGGTATGVACLVADHTIPWSDAWHSASRWFVGDEIGLLGLAPFLLIHVFPWVRKKLRQPTRQAGRQTGQGEVPKFDATKAILALPEAMGQSVCLLASLWPMFWPPMGNLLFMSFVPVLWMAVRQGVRRVSTGIVALNFCIVITMHWLPQPPRVLNGIGLFMFVVSAAGLIVGSIVSDRQRTESNLRERTVYLDSLIENSPLGIVVLNRDGRVEIANEAFTKLFLFEEQGELIGSRLHELFPIERPEEASWSSQVISGLSLHRIVRRHRRDGKVLDLEMQALPLVVDGSVRGAYAMCRDISEQVRASEAEREHAVALNQLVKELEVQADQMTLLNEMASMLECCATMQEACTVVQESSRKLFSGASFMGLYTFRASRNLVEVAASWGNSGPSQSVFGPSACWALRRGKPHWSGATGGGISCPHLNEMEAAWHLCVPMVGQGETLGILDLGFAGPAGEATGFRHSQQQLGVAVAAQIALSLASLQLREKLRSQSIRDPLTGLFNRRFMLESLDREMIRARRKNRALSVLFIDIDHFKQFNDTFGHDAGDHVLQSFAELLNRFFRGDDVACRWGGEEFAVILPEAHSDDATARANSLRAEVKQLGLQYRGTRLASITLSIGVATFPENGSTSEDLIRIADQCLYKSKSAGRDCVTISNPVEA